MAEPTLMEKLVSLCKRRGFIYPGSDIYGGLLKSFVFGIIIAVMGCFYGFQTVGGAEGVGIATTRAVVTSCVLILVADYFLAEVIFRLLFPPAGAA